MPLLCVQLCAQFTHVASFGWWRGPSHLHQPQLPTWVSCAQSNSTRIFHVDICTIIVIIIKINECWKKFSIINEPSLTTPTIGALEPFVSWVEFIIWVLSLFLSKFIHVFFFFFFFFDRISLYMLNSLE